MMNLDYGDARNKNNSTGQNKLNKFTTNTYASSLINYTSTFPTLTSSLNSNSSMQLHTVLLTNTGTTIVYVCTTNCDLSPLTSQRTLVRIEAGGKRWEA